MTDATAREQAREALVKALDAADKPDVMLRAFARDESIHRVLAQGAIDYLDANPAAKAAVAAFIERCRTLTPEQARHLAAAGAVAGATAGAVAGAVAGAAAGMRLGPSSSATSSPPTNTPRRSGPLSMQG